MASNNAPTTFGAVIVPTAQKNANNEITPPPPVIDSPALTPAVSREDLTPEFSDRRIPPHSPFYQHPPASFERAHSRQNSKDIGVVNEKDLESGLRTPLAPHTENPFAGKVSVDCNKECRMWPSKQTLIQSRKAEKRRKRDQKCCGGCGPVVDFWARFTKRQKLFIKIALVVFVLGVIAAIAVGISIAVNGTVYVSNGQTESIPNPGDGN
jgi:hypothetical protein